MARHFNKLTRKAIRALLVGERIAEHGIIAERLGAGDVRYSVNIMVDGQRIHRVVGRESEGTTRTQCEDFVAGARRVAKEHRLGEILPKRRKIPITFSSASEEYLRMLRESNGKDYQNNQQHLRLHLVPYFGTMQPVMITKFTIEKYKRWCGEKGLSEGTINRTLATFRRMGRRLYEETIITDPFVPVKIPREKTRRTFVLSPEEEVRLIEASLGDSNPYIWLFIKMALATSLRHSEILGASFLGFDPQRRRLRVLVKGGKWRDQPLPRSITEILIREREMTADPDGWIFPNPRTKTGHYDRMVKSFRRCVVKADLDPKIVTPHTFRHTAITRLVAAGADVKTVQEFSGHESIEMVMRYTHSQDRAVDLALDKLEQRTVVELAIVQKQQNR